MPHTAPASLARIAVGCRVGVSHVGHPSAATVPGTSVVGATESVGVDARTASALLATRATSCSRYDIRE